MTRADIQDEQRVWGAADSLQFYQMNRQRPEDMYTSERFFLPEILPSAHSVLDVGCAAGGFSRIMKSFNPTIDYTGVDINPQFVEIARRAFPDSRFKESDGINFDTPECSYDLVHSTGVLLHNSRYADMAAACYRQARRYIIYDFRLTWGPSVVGTNKLQFEPAEGDRPLLPYVVLNVHEMV